MSKSKLVRDNASPEEVRRAWAADPLTGESPIHRKSKHNKGRTSPIKKKKKKGKR